MGLVNRVADRPGAEVVAVARSKYRKTGREVISVAEEGLEIQEEYFHSRQELHAILRELGFDARVEQRPVAVERRRNG